MPHELRNFGPALHYLEQDPQHNLLLIHSLRVGTRPGFSVIVDDPERVRAVLAVCRPDWKKPENGPMVLQIDALDREAAMGLLSWLPRGPRYRIVTYRPWLSDLARALLNPDHDSHQSYCLVSAAGGLCEPSPSPGGAGGNRPYASACEEWVVEGPLR